MVSMKDIAKQCNVSVASVSKALNGYSDISEETRQLILKTASEMGYLPNSSARALKTRRSYNLGVLFVDEAMSGLTHDYFNHVLESFKRTAESRGYDITFTSGNLSGQHLSYYEHCRYRGVDGVVIACINFFTEEVQRLVQSEIPVVTIDHVFDGRIAVVSNNIQGMEELVSYILERGHRKIAYIHGEDSSVTRNRLGSFYRTLQKKRIDIPDEYMPVIPYRDAEAAAIATSELLDLKDPPTCILYPDDFSALGGINEIHERGLRIPDDISIAGYEEVADQYQYTKDVMTDSDGNLKGLSWQGCPGAMIYRRDIAKEVFGSDDPAEVQKKVADWDTFKATAEELKEKGYQMTSTVNDAYRVFSNNVTSPWVVDGKITVDDNIKNWVDMSKEMVDAGETATYELWSDDWSKGFFKDSNVFSYFGPAWFIDFSMSADQDGSVGKDGGWAATEGPQGFYWGGTWITAAAGTDNPTLVADIMRTMTTNVDVMKEIVTADNDFVNNKPAMEEMAKDESYGDAVLGGQNPLAMFCAGADKIDLSNMSIYDQGCNEEFQNAMKNYFEGNASYDEALDLFYKAVVEKYPELSY